VLPLKMLPFYGILQINFWLVVKLLVFSVDPNIWCVGADGRGEADINPLLTKLPLSKNEKKQPEKSAPENDSCVPNPKIPRI